MASRARWEWLALTVLVNLLIIASVIIALRWPDAKPIVLRPAATLAPGVERNIGLEPESDLPSAPTDEEEIDINSASAAELEALPGIGPALSARIVQYRDLHGAFSSVEELMNVEGIGPKTMDGLRDLVTAR